MDDLRQLPRFDDSMSYVYVEHARIEQNEKAVAIIDPGGKTPVPAAALAVLMLGPGTSITHAAVKALADNNCTVAWVGEDGLRFYAAGMGGTRRTVALTRQARLVSHPASRLAVVRRMYLKRFPNPLDPTLTLEQIRGMEGIRVREAYAAASRTTGIPWSGRNYKRGDWAAADPVNRALSAGNACLYGVVQAAILSAGYSPALGFIHTGKQLSFVYDVADLYKAEIIIPTAFETASWQSASVEKQMRIACRQKFRDTRILQRILPDIAEVLDVDSTLAADDPTWDEDPSAPGALWDPDRATGTDGFASGGVNYGADDS